MRLVSARQTLSTRDVGSHNATSANQPGGDRNNLLPTTLRRRDKALTFVNVLVQLVNERVQMLPLLAGKLQCIAGVDPLTQRTGNHTRQRRIQSSDHFQKHLHQAHIQVCMFPLVVNLEDLEEKVYLVPMP